MSEERKKILEILAAGKISPDEAERLLEKIEAGARSAETPRASGDRKGIKYLRVHVDSRDGDKVNVRVPINLIRTGIKLGAILPQGACERIHESGLALNSLTQLADEDLVEALADLQADVDSENGDVVRVFCE